MHAGDWIAGYAAIVATSAFAWQFVTYWRARLPKLALEISPAVIVTEETGARTLLALYDGRAVEPQGVEWYFDLLITNRGRGRVQVTGIHISQAVSSGRLGWDAGRRADLPSWLEPGEERSLRFTDDDLGGAALTEAVDINVLTSMGKTFAISGRVLGPESAVISTMGFMQEVVARAGAADRLFLIEVHQLGETPIIKREHDHKRSSAE
jgi:hypothetical protein